MTNRIVANPLTAQNFAGFGDVLEAAGDPDKIINQGRCGRFHDRARLDFDTKGRAGVSIFEAQPVDWPAEIALVERHPEGSQAFVPMSAHPYLVVVCETLQGGPGPLHAFVAGPGQAINFHRGTWHGVLTPLHAPGIFAVVDRIGPGRNLEEHWFDIPYLIEPGIDCKRAELI